MAEPAVARRLRSRVLVSLTLIALTLAGATLVRGEGSGTIYRGSDPTQFRSHLEWRTSSYGGGDSLEFVLLRRTLLKVYALAGESILLGSSGIGVGASPDNGDIRVFNPGAVTGTIGQELIPALTGSASPPQDGGFANGFSCVAQRALTADGRGRISSRAQELAGPLPNTGGYAPCVYVAPATGIYDVVFTGPSGDNANTEPNVSGSLDSPAADFGVNQRTGVTAWDVTVRDTGGATRSGRLFAYYYTGNTGGGGRPLSGQAFAITASGFLYRITFTGDPFGFIFYANQFGFRNTDGNPLYHNLLADPLVSTQQQNQLRELQGGVTLLPPQYPLFISAPDPLVLDALGIPRTPDAPAISSFTFNGALGGANTGVGQGGTFRFTTAQPGVFAVVVSRDGSNFDPTEPGNRVQLGVADTPGSVSVDWDGLDNEGTPFPLGEFRAGAVIQGGEVHFPFLDVENNVAGGPIIELVNPPDRTGDGAGDCPPWNGGCFGAFYDDRGYRTASGDLVGTAVGGPLCPGDGANPRGFGNPPLIAASDQVFGFDTRSGQRSFGFPFDANPASVCLPDGGFGDKKGLDLWTYYPSNSLQTPLNIIDPTAVTLRSFTAHRSAAGVELRWETGTERNTLGFHILRSATGNLADATRVTLALIPARGGPAEGAAYNWTDGEATDPAVPVSYWLEELETGGNTLRYGPARPGAAPATGPYRIGLPLLVEQVAEQGAARLVLSHPRPH
ncbi:MAG: hypothetical protein OHK0015_41230 [Chloroflexi bacterium OHK40]